MKKFSIRERVKSFRYALNGIGQFFREEHNARIHLAATILMIILAIFLKVSKGEVILLTLVTGLVWAAELLNTAIEKAMDLISVKKDPRIRFIKDVAAAAVLVMAIVALTTGCIVFIPKL
ncbi:MAG TPA: diacylglycerol kinase family protein [Chitinophagaceae bacterium]|jgi:diacylglycerol kinase (ATP)|nr:diacylglycerol kinase family protein [Chitinophagaceae bacterium]